VGVFVGSGVAVFVGVCVGVAVGGGVLVGVAVGVGVSVGVGVGEGLAVRVGVAVAVNVGLGVRVATAISLPESLRSNWASAAATRIQTMMIAAKIMRRIFIDYLRLCLSTRVGYSMAAL